MTSLLQTLLNDAGFGTTMQRNAYLSRILEREIRFLDQLTYDEAYKMIDEFTEQRRDQRQQARNDQDSEC